MEVSAVGGVLGVPSEAVSGSDVLVGWHPAVDEFGERFVVFASSSPTVRLTEPFAAFVGEAASRQVRPVLVTPTTGRVSPLVALVVRRADGAWVTGGRAGAGRAVPGGTSAGSSGRARVVEVAVGLTFSTEGGPVSGAGWSGGAGRRPDPGQVRALLGGLGTELDPLCDQASRLAGQALEDLDGRVAAHADLSSQPRAAAACRLARGRAQG